MKNQYIVRMADSRLLSIYHSDASGIVVRTFDNGRWSKPTPIAPEMQENFMLSIDERGFIYMFTQHTNSDIYLYRQQHSTWSSRIMLAASEDRQTSLHAYPIIYNNRMSIVYNHSSGDNSALILRRIDERGKWLTPITIDNYTPLQSDFSVQSITPTHHLLFYAKKSADTAIGYVEIDPERITAFRTIFSTNQRITDTSFLVTNSTIHALFIIKSMFSAQLVYRKKSGTSFSAPITIAEAPQISNCLLMFVSGKLHAYFISNGQLVSATSTNFGDTFSGVSRCTNKFCVSPAKSTYVSQIPMDENTYFARQLFVDRNNAADIQLLPDMYEDFYLPPTSTTLPETAAANYSSSHQSNTPDELTLLQDKLNISQMQLQEKERQLARHILAHNSEKAQLLERIKQLESTLHKLQAKPASTILAPINETRKYPLMII